MGIYSLLRLQPTESIKRAAPGEAALTIKYRTVYNRHRKALQQAVSPV